MTDVLTSAPPAAWYPDPAQPELLRWWDGSAWSTHTMERPDEAPVIETAPAAPQPPSLPPVMHTLPAPPIPEPMPFVSGVAQAAAGPELRSSDAPSLSPIERAARAEIYAKLASAHAQESVAAEPARSVIDPFATSHSLVGSGNWAPPSPLDTIPLRSSTGGAWLLALSPLLALGAFALVAFQLTKPPIQLLPIIAVYAIAVLAPFVFAGADRVGLRHRGHTERPSWWWMLLLPPLVYLIVRTVKLSRRSRAAFVPLVVYLIASLVTVAATTLIGPAAGGAIVDHAKLAILDQVEVQTEISLKAQTGGDFDVNCPDTLDPPITCHAVADDGTAVDFEVQFDARGVPTVVPLDS